jgi:peroxiredoxin Q/BCP
MSAAAKGTRGKARRTRRPPAKAAHTRRPPAKPAHTRPAPAKAGAPQRPIKTAAAEAQLAAGKPVPTFTLPATGGGLWRLADARGRKLVLYFYPRDNTPGCTLEGQQFAALAPRFDAAGVTIVGISRDSLAAHEKFRAKMGFPFLLLSDADGSLCRQMDVMRIKNMYGRKVLGIERSTFLLDANGVLQREWRKVKVEGHALAVLEAAQAL